MVAGFDPAADKEQRLLVPTQIQKQKMTAEAQASFFRSPYTFILALDGSSTPIDHTLRQSATGSVRAHAKKIANPPANFGIVRECLTNYSAASAMKS